MEKTKLTKLLELKQKYVSRRAFILATGLPIIATRVGGIPEVVNDGYNGFLVEEKDYKAASHILTKIISDPQLRRLLGRNGRAKALEVFDWKNIWPIYKELFRSSFSCK